MLLQNPEMEVSYNDCDWGTAKVKSVQQVKVLGNDYHNDEQLQELRDEIAAFSTRDLNAEYQNLIADTDMPDPVEFWGPLSEFVAMNTKAYTNNIERLAKFDATEYYLQIVGDF